MSKIQYNTGSNKAFETVYEYTYDAAGNLFSITDRISNEVTMYKYDATGKLMDSYVYDLATYNNLYGTTVYYDDQSRVSVVFHGFDYKYSSGTSSDLTHYSYAYNANNGNLSNMAVEGDYLSGNVTPTYDNLGRTSQKLVDFNVNNADAFYNKLTYDYATLSDGYESGRVSKVVSEVRKGSGTSVLSSTTYNYTYDANGNITQITDASGTIQYKYYYDDLGQLIREDNRALGYSYVYTYDNAGNITSKKRYAFTTNDSLGSVQNTTNYTYGDSTWKDLLMNYGGTSITYDEIGNPETIGDKTLTWKGRELISYTDEGTTVSYGYNADGIRTYKEINNGGQIERHEYVLSGSQIVKETVFVNGVEQYILVYVYDETGAPIGIKYRTPSYAENVYTCYFFEKNLQGDIVAIYNASGTKIGTYTYDAWGNVTTSIVSASGTDRLILATYNPFKYRGYYYDSDSGWYYLQSTYYNPTWGRFISADSFPVLLVSPGQLFDKNIFAYCDNNPITRKDDGGALWETAFDVVSLAFSVVDVVENPTDPRAWISLAGDAVDLIPFVTGVGEVTRAVTTFTRIAETAVLVSDVYNLASEAVDYYITPDGDAIPSTLSGFNDNLSKLENRNGKYCGTDIHGYPIRIRVEIHDHDPNFVGKKNPFHEVPHFHIDRKANKKTGKWIKKFTGFLGDLF